jgi:hypothetical protein
MTTVPARYLPLLILLVLFGCSDESTEIESASGPQTGPLMPLLVPDPLSVEAVAALVSDIRGPAYALHFNDEESLYKSPTVMSTYAFPPRSPRDPGPGMVGRRRLREPVHGDQHLS